VGVGIGVEREIRSEQAAAQRLVHGRHAREAEVERGRRQRPEILVPAGQRVRPGVFELLGAPERGECIGVRPYRIAVPADCSVDVEQGAVGVEHVWHADGSQIALMTNFHEP
jgi:hypothetical protein